jgi:hypothetical protein
LRTRIEGFNQGRIIEDLISSEDLRHAELTRSLRRIASDWKHLNAKSREQRGWRFDRYMELRKDGLLDNLRARLKCRLRRDTACILNGMALTFSEALGLDKASLFNTLIAFLLYDLKAFSYVAGKSSCNGSHVRITQGLGAGGPSEPFVVEYKVDRLIVRHGTHSEHALNLIGLNKDAVKAIKKRQESASKIKPTEELWPAGWWRTNQVVPGKLQEPVEFVPPATIAIATTFVSTLSDVLRLRLRQEAKQSRDAGSRSEGPEFRITLHRVIEIRGVRLFQQIAYYAGTRQKGSPGRVFQADVGIVGLTCRTGIPILIRSGPRWDELWQGLNATTDYGINTIADNVHSMLTCPFFAPLEDAENPDRDRRVSLVLFMDSELHDFFSDDVQRTVFSASAGFVKNLNMLAANGTVRCASRSFLGYKVEHRAEDAHLIRDFEEVKSTNEVFEQFAPSLTFKTVQSFDLHMSHSQ